MTDFLCPLHENPILGYSIVHTCFFCPECRDCRDEANAIRLGDLRADSTRMTYDIRGSIVKLQGAVDCRLRYYRSLLERNRGVMQSIEALLNDPDAFFERTVEEIHKLPELFKCIPSSNSSHVLQNVRIEICEVGDCREPLREEIAALKGWQEQLLNFKTMVERKIIREQLNMSFLRELERFPIDQEIEWVDMKLVLHVALNTNWLSQDGEVLQIVERPPTPDLPIVGRLKQSMDMRKELEQKLREKDEELKKEKKEAAMKLEMLTAQYSEQLERLREEKNAVEKELESLQESLIPPEMLLNSRLEKVNKRILVLKQDDTKEGGPEIKSELDHLYKERMELIPHAQTPRRVYDPVDFSAFPGVEEHPWVKSAVGIPLKSVIGFGCSKTIRVEEIKGGDIQSVALSSFGILMMYEHWERQLHFYDLIVPSHFSIEGFKDDALVTWYKSDVVALMKGDSVALRSPYLSLLEKPNISTFMKVIIPECSFWQDIQMAQYTGKILYSSNDTLAILDLETMKCKKVGIFVGWNVDTGCILPRHTIGLMCTRSELFFIDEDGKVIVSKRISAWSHETLLSRENQMDLDRALIRLENSWLLPGEDETITNRRFFSRSGWNGSRFVRLKDDVFLILDREKNWNLIRIQVP